MAIDWGMTVLRDAMHARLAKLSLMDVSRSQAASIRPAATKTVSNQLACSCTQEILELTAPLSAIKLNP